MDVNAGAEIFAAILWFVFGDLLVVLVTWGLIGLGALIAAATDRVWPGVVGFILGILGGLFTLVLVWWNVITHALAAGSAIWGW